jgi:hypothetical protein
VIRNTVKLQLSARFRDRSNDGWENRRVVESVLKNDTLRNKYKILYYIIYYSVCGARGGSVG